MLVIGLAGGIGTGKSQVANILKDLGAAIVNADLLGHEVYRPDTDGWREVVDAFGEGVLTPGGEVDRGKLGAIVFSDPKALGRLNAITHPRIYKMVERRIDGLRAEGRMRVVVEAALLVEANWGSLVNEVWMTSATEDRVVRRLKARSGLDEKAVVARIQAQMPQAERTEYADIVIDNNGTLEDLKERVQNLWDERAQARKESEH
jgi:dephospho-CoA kinase